MANAEEDAQFTQMGFDSAVIKSVQEKYFDEWASFSFEERVDKLLNYKPPPPRKPCKKQPAQISKESHLFFGTIDYMENRWGKILLQDSRDKIFFLVKDFLGIPYVGCRVQFYTKTVTDELRKEHMGKLNAYLVAPVKDCEPERINEDDLFLNPAAIRARTKPESNSKPDSFVDNVHKQEIHPEPAPIHNVANPVYPIAAIIPQHDPRFSQPTDFMNDLWAPKKKRKASENFLSKKPIRPRSVSRENGDTFEAPRAVIRPKPSPPSNNVEAMSISKSISKSKSCHRSRSKSLDRVIQSEQLERYWQLKEEFKRQEESARALDEGRYHYGLVAQVPTREQPGFVKLLQREKRVPLLFDAIPSGQSVFPKDTFVRFRVVPDDTWIQRIHIVEKTILPIIYEEQPFHGIIDDLGNQKMAMFFGQEQNFRNIDPYNVADFLTPDGRSRVNARMMVQRTKIDVDETRHYEFKLYTDRTRFDKIAAAIEKYSCAFLNSKVSGTILFGIHDSSVVYGIHVPDRDKLRSETIDAIFESMHPKVDTQYYTIKFIPLVSKDGYPIKDLYVIKLNVRVEESNDCAPVYRTNDYKYWIRRDGSVRLMDMDMVRNRENRKQFSAPYMKELNKQKENKEREIVNQLCDDMGLDKGKVLTIVFDFKSEEKRAPSPEEILQQYFNKVDIDEEEL